LGNLGPLSFAPEHKIDVQQHKSTANVLP
jgi:hypothetical protein